MQILGQTTVVLVAAAMVAASPAKLLRVPKIYNALITSNEKILPSEAYPAATGPIFQPIGLSGTPILIQPEIDNSELFNVKEGDKVNILFDSTKKSKTKTPQPLTFFPRHSVYYPNQPHLLIHHPFVYTPLENPSVTTRNFRITDPNDEHKVNPQLENEEKKDLSYQRSHHMSRPTSAGATAASSVSMEYVKNNRPLDPNIPIIPPPPPPIRYRDID